MDKSALYIKSFKKSAFGKPLLITGIACILFSILSMLFFPVNLSGYYLWTFLGIIGVSFFLFGLFIYKQELAQFEVEKGYKKPTSEVEVQKFLKNIELSQKFDWLQLKIFLIGAAVIFVIFYLLKISGELLLFSMALWGIFSFIFSYLIVSKKS